MANNMYNNKYEFEWDDNKNQINIAKHGIPFEKAQLAFRDERRILEFDRMHLDREERFFCIGEIKGKIATVRFTVRGNRIRIIGAGYWRKGRRQYGRLDRSGT